MIIIKFVDPSTDSTETHRFDHVPVSLGRARDNDVILLDPSISAYHARIEKTTDGLYIRDLGSTNGMMEEDRRRELIPLDEPKSFRLGNVNVQVMTSEDVLEKTVQVNLDDFPLDSDWSLRKGFSLSIFVLLCGILSRVIKSQLFMTTFELHSFIAACLLQIGLVVGIALVTSIFSKLHLKKYQFFRLFTFTYSLELIFELCFYGAHILVFNLNADGLAQPLIYIFALIILFFGLLHYGRLLLPELGEKRRRVFVAALLALIYAGTLGYSYSKNLRDKSPDFNAIISKPLRPIDGQLYSFQNLSQELDNLDAKIIRHRETVLKQEQEEKAEEP